MVVPFNLSSIFCDDFWLAHKVQEVINKNEVTTAYLLHSFLQPVNCVSVCTQLVLHKELSDLLPTGLLLQDTCCSGKSAQLSEWVCVCWFEPYIILSCSLCLKLQSLTRQYRVSFLMQLDNELSCTPLFWVSHVIVLQWIHTVPLLFLTLKSCIVKFDNSTIYSLISSTDLSLFNLS